MICLGSGDFSTAETAAAFHLDTACAHSHGAADGIFHSTAEADSLFQLLSNVLCNQLSIGIRSAYFNDGESDGLADQLLNRCTQFLDLLAALADYDAGSCTVDEYAYFCGISFDLDGGNTGRIKILFQILTNFVIFYDQVSHFIRSCIPSGIPIFNDTNTESMRIYFLSH